MFSRIALFLMLAAPGFALAPRSPANVTELIGNQLAVIPTYPDACSSTCGAVNTRYDNCMSESCLCSSDFSKTFLACCNCAVKAAGSAATPTEKQLLQDALDSYSSACHINKLKLSSGAGRMCTNTAFVGAGAAAAAALAAISL